MEIATRLTGRCPLCQRMTTEDEAATYETCECGKRLWHMRCAAAESYDRGRTVKMICSTCSTTLYVKDKYATPGNRPALLAWRSLLSLLVYLAIAAGVVACCGYLYVGCKVGSAIYNRSTLAENERPTLAHYATTLLLPSGDHLYGGLALFVVCLLGFILLRLGRLVLGYTVGSAIVWVAGIVAVVLWGPRYTTHKTAPEPRSRASARKK